MNTEQRDDVAEILEKLSREGLQGPRDLDVALDAIECSLKVPGNPPVLAPCPWCGEPPDVSETVHYDLSSGSRKSKSAKISCKTLSCLISPSKYSGALDLAVKAWNLRNGINVITGEIEGGPDGESAGESGIVVRDSPSGIDM